MNEWLQVGRNIAAQEGIEPSEKAELEAYILAIELSRGARVQDGNVPMAQIESAPAELTESQAKAAEIENRLQQLALEYNTKLHTPDFVTQTHQEIWQARGELVGVTYEVTPCPLTQEELADLEASGKRLGYLPAELATQQSRHKLGEMYPKMQSHSVKEGNSVTNDESPSGWFDYETAIDAPYLDTKEGQLMDKIKKDERKILSLNQYVVAGQDSKLFTGQYLDEVSTVVRLGSRYDGRVVHADFLRDGHLRVGWSLGTDHHRLRLGGRSSGVNKALNL